MRYSLMTLALFSTLLLAACGDGGTGPGSAASHVTTVRGDKAHDLTGAASFGSTNDPADPGFAILLDTPSEGTFMILGRVNNARPAVGTYQVGAVDQGEPDPAKFYGSLSVTLPDQTPAFLYYTTGGTVRVTKSTDARVEGTFELDAVGLNLGDPETPLTVRITGTFAADKAPDAPALHATATRVLVRAAN